MLKGQSLIFDIAKCSFVDGPGIRTTVFFKGCPLDCPWCHNPESKSYFKEQVFYKDNCISCGNCDVGKKCFNNARRIIGQVYSPEDLLHLILEDKVYYDSSKGGVTFSGGEALSFLPYLSIILPKLQKERVHTAVQTCGYFDYAKFESSVETYINLIYFDIKIFDRETHEKVLGKSNKSILENFERLLSTRIKIVPRIPLIDGYTATRKNIREIARYLKQFSVEGCEFIFQNNFNGTCGNPDDSPKNKDLIEYFKECI